MTAHGPVETALREDLRQIAAENAGVQRTLAETAYTLAARLDEVKGSASAGLAAAALAKQLVATLEALVGVGDDSDRTAEIIAQLSTPMGNAEES